jgi:hypothetical protein
MSKIVLLKGSFFETTYPLGLLKSTITGLMLGNSSTFSLYISQLGKITSISSPFLISKEKLSTNCQFTLIALSFIISSNSSLDNHLVF